MGHRAYADDSTNFEIYDVNTIATSTVTSFAILPTEAPAAFEREHRDRCVAC